MTHLRKRGGVRTRRTKQLMIPTPETLRRAGEIIAGIERLQTELAGLFVGSGPGRGRGKARGGEGRAAAGGGRKRRVMSPGARARIAAANKARWAKYRAEKKGGGK